MLSRHKQCFRRERAGSFQAGRTRQDRGDGGRDKDRADGSRMGDLSSFPEIHASGFAAFQNVIDLVMVGPHIGVDGVLRQL